MSKSKIPCCKVKRPCKVCLQTVSTKNGLQCCGQCQSWLHYKCANYTPGKIQDIKKGIIRVNCPCPDCESTIPKEYRTDDPSNCMNTQCPSNRPLACQNKGCPSSVEEDNSCPPKWPVIKCGALCKKFPAECVGRKSNSGSSCRIQNPACVQIPQNIRCKPQPSLDNTALDSLNLSTAVGDTNMSSGSLDSIQLSLKVLEQMCCTLGILSKQLTEVMAKMKKKKKGRVILSRPPSPPLSPPSTPQCFPTPPLPPKSPCSPTGTRDGCPKICKCPKKAK